MAKKTQSTETDRRDIAAPPENRPLDKSIVRYIIHSLLLVILFAWALIKLDSVMRFLEKCSRCSLRFCLVEVSLF